MRVKTGIWSTGFWLPSWLLTATLSYHRIHSDRGWEMGKLAVFANVTQEVPSEHWHSATTGTRRSHPWRPTRTSQGGGAEGSKAPAGRRSYFAPDNRQGPRVRQRVAWPQVEGQTGQIRAASFMGKKCPSILTKHTPERKQTWRMDELDFV